ncbi:unnamed protein product [Acanthoscelides obtectus]|uniref:Uncharacterized protein n=1 Tax=Acanthoscelides obtectus TaxID=200917 RepID=A0A9P0NYB1_ACAOB|nr:unnamed protein product [Acanthoscelides obtectus]CAK1666050.1 hypothetical protein AOBTE_LOCUS25128 [Acanthoscelides obtectus]
MTAMNLLSSDSSSEDDDDLTLGLLSQSN